MDCVERGALVGVEDVAAPVREAFFIDVEDAGTG